jgi:hypothetical protein
MTYGELTRSEFPAFRARVETNKADPATMRARIEAWADRFGISDPAGYLETRVEVYPKWYVDWLHEQTKGDRG